MIGPNNNAPLGSRFALIKPGPLVADIRGSIGGTTFARNRGGMYVRNRTTPLNPQSLAQSTVRATLGQLANNWTTVLTQAQRDAWDAWAGQVPVPNAFGEDRFLSGINAYVAGNALLSQAGESLVTTAPTVFAKGPSLNATYSLLASVDSVSLTAVGGFDPDASGVTVLSYISAPQNPGINFFKGPFRFVGAGQLSTGTPELPLAIGTSPFPFAVGQAVFVRTRVVTPDGRVGGSSVARFLPSP